MSHREHPRRRGFYVMGGGPIPGPADATLEDFLSGPPAGTPLESSAAGNLPACRGGHGDHAPMLDGHCALCGADLRDPVAAAVAWDQATAAEPYQVDVTRTLEDTTRMGNSLSAAVRLELLMGTMREEVQDRRLGPGFPPDFDADQLEAAGYDPVDGAELDPVDGLPIGKGYSDDATYRRVMSDEDQGDDVATDQLDDDVVTELAAWRTLADLEAEAAPLTYAAPAPPPSVTDDEVQAAVAMSAGRAVTTAGVPARVLNWTSRHDAKSLDYGVRQRLQAPAPLVDRLWSHGPILDQGTAPPLSLHDASGCTGHAGVNAANVLGLSSPHHIPGQELYGHSDAMRLYERAQELDEVPGEAYPGTSILAVMKAGQEFGFWGSYLWAFGTRDVAQAILQVGPVVVGIPWLSKMAAPGPDGILDVSGDDQGGHALCLFALRMKVAGRAGPFFGALQTWGPDVGDHGVVWVHHKDLARLLHGQGEAAIPIPDTLP